MTSPEHEPLAHGADGGGELERGYAVGEYRIDALLGKGGMGAVYAARQPEIGAQVAIKVLGAELSRDPRVVRRFVDEARAVNKIRHPNIIDIFAFGRLADGRQYFVMEHLEGETLGARMARGPLPVAEARRLLRQICGALEAAHAEKIVHRDLKPENIWLAAPRHGDPYIKILDFGIAKLMESQEAPAATEAGVAMGTPYFMSPEQCRGEAVDHRTDIYAMGVLLYLMWSGRLPFEGTSFLAVATQQITATPPPPSAHRAIPARLERLILSCLEKDPARRPQSARALGEELDAALAEATPGETVPAAAPAAGLQISAKTSRRRLLPVAMVLVVGVLLAVVAARTALRGRPSPKETAPTAPPVPTPSPTLAPPVAPPAPEPAPRVQPAPARARARPSPAAAPEPPAPSRLEQRGFLRENPFR